jgi:hypothetical protein
MQLARCYSFLEHANSHRQSMLAIYNQLTSEPSTINRRLMLDYDAGTGYAQTAQAPTADRL